MDAAVRVERRLRSVARLGAAARCTTTPSQVFDVAGTPPTLTKNDALEPQALLRHGGAARADGDRAVERRDAALRGDADRQHAGDPRACAGANYGAEIGRAQLQGVGALRRRRRRGVAHRVRVAVGRRRLGAATAWCPSMSPIRPSRSRRRASISTGKAAEAELLVAGKLYVSNADADTLSIVDAAVAHGQVAAGDLGHDPRRDAERHRRRARRGAQRRGRIYVANAGENAVVALDLDTLAIVGQVPTAWYPTAVAVARRRHARHRLGARARPRPARRHARAPITPHGTVQVVPRPSDDDLRAGTHDRRGQPRAPARARGAAAVPAATGRRSEIRRCRAAPARRRRSSTSSSSCARTRPTTACSAICRAATATPRWSSSAPTSRPTRTRWRRVRAPRQLLLARRAVGAGPRVDHRLHRQRLHREVVVALDDYGRAYLLAAPLGPAGTLSRLATPGSGSIWHHLDEAGVALPQLRRDREHRRRQDARRSRLSRRLLQHVDRRQREGRLRARQHQRSELQARAVHLHLAAERSHQRHVEGRADAAVDGRQQRRGDRPLHRRAVAHAAVEVVGGVRRRGRSGRHARSRRGARSLCLVASPWVKRGYHSSTQVRSRIDLPHHRDDRRRRPDEPQRRARRGDVRALHRQARLLAVDLRAAQDAGRVQRRRRAAVRRVGAHRLHQARHGRSDAHLVEGNQRRATAEPPVLIKRSKLDRDDDD